MSRMDELKTIGQRIKHIRTQRELTQSELGEMLGRVTSAVQAWEYDQAVPKITELLKLAELGDTSIDWICSDSGFSSEKVPDGEAVNIREAVDDLMAVGQRIKDIRKLKSMSQAELGELLERGQSAIYSWESGESFPRMPELIKLAELGETTIDWICTGSKPIADSPSFSEASLEVARMYDACSYPDKEKIWTLTSACFRESFSVGSTID